MNKKRLSVVMAGAMLATSVAPVLAAEKYEVNSSNKGILIRDLRNLLESKKFANEKVNGSYAGKSVYRVEVYNQSGTKTATLETASDIETTLKTLDSTNTLKVVDKGHREDNGKYYAKADKETIVETLKYETASQLKDEFTKWNSDKNKVTNYPAVYKMSYDENTKVLTVLTRAAASESAHLTLTYKVGSDMVDFKKAVDGDKLTDDLALVDGFQVKTVTIPEGGDLPLKVLAEISLTDFDATHEVVLSDLYDGLLLTEKGQKLLDAIKEYDKDSKKDLGYPRKQNVSDIDDTANGIYSIKMLFKYNGKQEELTIKSNDRNKLEILQKVLRLRKPAVDVLAGDNRYETAVKVAKENASIEDVAINGNIVLVNGNALVDGLAAAPLASSVWNKKGGQLGSDVDPATEVAPILLTGSDSLPKATKDYIRELVGKQTIENVDKITVYLVGGEAVLSTTLEKELKDLGLRVVRAGGANREETSLEVAKLMEKENDVTVNNAFVVGANGEADAMSIASVAAEKEQPIIVSKPGGLSNDAIEYLKGYKATATKSATIIGGESAVSKDTEEAIKEEKISVERISGNNRQATNAAIINKYAKTGLRQLVISKDGIANKSELVDALTATSLAVKHNAPIVLATNKLSDSQVNAIELKANRNNIDGNVYVYQVGHGVARDVLKTIAERVGLAK